jgi:hypothetical protein
MLDVEAVTAAVIFGIISNGPDLSFLDGQGGS